MPTAMTLPLLPVVLVSGEYAEGFLTDHNRSELSVSYDEIGNSDRTVSGTMRGYVITRKRTFSLSWSNVPADASCTVDGFWGGNELKSFYDNTFGYFTVKFYSRANVLNINNPLDSVAVRMKSFDYEVVKRGVMLTNGNRTDLWNFSCSFEEI